MSRVVLACVSFLLTPAWVQAASGPAVPDFDRDVAPLLARRCLDCHSGAAPKGKLDLSRRQGAGRALVAGKPEESELWQRVQQEQMPPKKPLPSGEKEVLRRWIAAGAKWGADPIDPYRVSTRARAGYDWWSLRPVVRPVPPVVKNTAWARNPIDNFVLARLEARGLAPSLPADRRTLIRRLTFDLTGLDRKSTRL